MKMRRSHLALTAVLLAAVVGATAALAKDKKRPDPRNHWYSEGRRIYVPMPEDRKSWTKIELNEEQKKGGTVLILRLKRPDSPDHFDAILEFREMAQKTVSQGRQQNMQLTFKDPETGAETTIATSAVKQLAQYRAGLIEKSFKDIKERKKLRKTRISRTIKSGHVYEIMGLPKRGGMPMKRRFYCFGANEKTYFLDLLLTTTTMKDKELVKAIDKMIGSLIAYKP